MSAGARLAKASEVPTLSIDMSFERNQEKHYQPLLLFVLAFYLAGGGGSGEKVLCTLGFKAPIPALFKTNFPIIKVIHVSILKRQVVL